MKEISNENIELIKKFIQINNKNYYCDSNQLTKVYNEVLGKNAKNTNCGTCLKQRVFELEKHLNKYLTEKEKENNDGTEETRNS